MTSDFDLADPAALAPCSCAGDCGRWLPGRPRRSICSTTNSARKAPGGYDWPRREPIALSRRPARRRCLDPWRTCGARGRIAAACAGSRSGQARVPPPRQRQRRAIMNPEQRTAVVAYLDALLTRSGELSRSRRAGSQRDAWPRGASVHGRFPARCVEAAARARPGASYRRAASGAVFQHASLIEGDPRAAAALGRASVTAEIGWRQRRRDCRTTSTRCDGTRPGRRPRRLPSDCRRRSNQQFGRGGESAGRDRAVAANWISPPGSHATSCTAGVFGRPRRHGHRGSAPAPESVDGRCRHMLSTMAASSAASDDPARVRAASTAQPRGA